MAELELSLALSDNIFTRPLLDGHVAVVGIRLVPTALHPSEMFWRQLRFGDFDVSEMSMSSLLISAAREKTDWIALPVFTTREFFHTRILVRADAGIATPSDLRCKRVGVPEYQQTAAIWGRGILQHEFGVSPGEIEWFMERGVDKSHGSATGFAPPAGVSVNPIAPETNIGEMLMCGELDATLFYLADRNLVDRSRLDIASLPQIKPLFADRGAEGRRYYVKTGLYPINHTLVMRRSLYERHPWIALNLFSAFVRAKEAVASRAQAYLRAYFDLGLIGDEAKRALAGDPMAYGVKAARPVLETIAQYVHEQGLSSRRIALEEVFAPSTLDL